MLEIFSSSTEETKSIGAGLMACLGCGDFVSLIGDLGAGKTQLVQGAARRICVKEDVISPTFNILLQYDGSFEGQAVTLNHFDLYRLESEEDLDDIDYFQLTDSNESYISFVEWANKFEDAVPDEYVEVKIRRIDEDSRAISIVGVGRRGQEIESKFRLQLA